MVTIKLMKKIEGRNFRWPFRLLSIPDRFVTKTYHVPMITCRSIREGDVVYKVLEKINSGTTYTREDVDACCIWFCGLFQNQFSVDDLLDGYEADSLMQDIFAAYLAMNSAVIKELKEFPIPPTVEDTTKKT